MLKKEFFLAALKANAHYAREWVIRAFTVTMTPTTTPWMIYHEPEGVYAVIPGHEGQNEAHVRLEDAIPYEIPFVYHDQTGVLRKGDVINLDRNIESTTWGVVLINARVLGYACGDLIPFMEGPFTPYDIEKIFVTRMKDNPADGKELPGELYVRHWLAVGKAVGDLDGFEFYIPSVTEHALQPYPGLVEDRTRLLGEHTPDELRDPVIQAKIQNELVANYKDYLKGDPSEGFIFKEKTIATSLKQMFLIHGPEAGFTEGGQAVLVPTSLDEGLNTKYFPEMMNSLRAGAFFRGAMTALAGTDVDLIGRIFQTARIQEKFCGTTDVVLNVLIDERYSERNILVNGERVQLTPEVLKTYKGSRQSMFDPAFCKAGNGENDVCSVCIGGRLARYPTSLGSAVAEKQSVLMSVMMASAHAKALKTVPLKDNWLE